VGSGLEEWGGKMKIVGENPPLLMKQNPMEIYPGWIYQWTIIAELDVHKP
jgi:hypothetical protein